MALREYERKRDFARTPEPRGAARASASGRLYVIQKHAARRLHYDLRLELDGALLSWATPKGPSLDPKEKRLAVRTEDHPIDYGGFEGVIPEGEYGAGTVMLWDTGEWAPLLGDPRETLPQGELKFELFGQKLRGGFMLVRLKGDDGKNWLLIKEQDAEARSEDRYCTLDEEPFSVLTNRTIPEIAADRDRLWTAGGESGDGARGPTTPTWTRRLPSGPLIELDPTPIPNARPAGAPSEWTAGAPACSSDSEPPRAVQVAQPPAGDDWIHEIELLGERIIGQLDRDQVSLRATDGADWTSRLPEIARAVSAIPFASATLDGMIIVPDARGVSDPAALREAVAQRRHSAVRYHLFDLPYCDGCDLRQSPLLRRKALLHEALASLAPEAARVLAYVEHIEGAGAAVHEQAQRLGVPGLVSKRAQSPYEDGEWRVVGCATGPPVERSTGPQVDRSAGPQPSNLPTFQPPDLSTSQPSDPATRSRARVVTEPGFYIRGVRITNPQRVLYPEERVRKQTLAEHYERVADLILPHIAGRPLSLYRCPRGYEQECFFQKHLNEPATQRLLGDTSLKHLRDAPVRENEGKEPYIALDGVEGLLTLAQLSVLEIHPWGSREDNIERPDRLIFDLDPGPNVGWRQLADAALAVRDALAQLGLVGFLKTSGGKGLHVVAPIARRIGWAELKAFAGAVAIQIVRSDPRRYTATMTKSNRKGKIFIDYLRNVRGATCVAAYSTRARAGALVSTPLRWEELGDHPIAFNVLTLPQRLEAIDGDPWAGFFERPPAITRAMMRTVGLKT